MQKFTILAVLCIAFLQPLFGQVSISPNDNPPHPSSALDIQSSTGGLLAPRMSTEERDAISTPAEGLLIFNTTTKCYNFFAYSGWHDMACATPPPSGFNCGTSLTDARDNNVYPTVQIGSQCWMAANLNYSQETGMEWCYDDDIANCEIYGKLYNWDAAMQGESGSTTEPSGVRGICPEGWHLPSHHEWTTLERAVCISATCETDFPYDFTTNGWSLYPDNYFSGTDEDARLKAVSPLWILNLGNNASGFSALPGGGEFDGFYDQGIGAGWWTSTPYTESASWIRYLYEDGEGLYIGNEWMIGGVWRSHDDNIYGYSVRCVLD